MTEESPEVSAEGVTKFVRDKYERWQAANNMACWTASYRPCYVSGTFSIRSGLLAFVHSLATDDTRGIFLCWFFLLMTGISMILCCQMKQQASVRRTYKKEMVVAQSTLVHLGHSAHAQLSPLII
ncbi:cytochrome c biogenesis CcmF N-terminal-like mitochondrial protein 2 [Humulus lupulus]|uniref:cytochrome c biogenesis CcmF N-terminal-like mitochondrial protein 2 n=1 Tax=Humulus lupulus TaxID=3486 RepID=UPI002B412FE0|nr:cytochrome c biogenesis CcmF N-terminal-like mitochondrial protein 2 [Humulus lupulus]